MATASPRARAEATACSTSASVGEFGAAKMRVALTLFAT